MGVENKDPLAPQENDDVSLVGAEMVAKREKLLTELGELNKRKNEILDELEEIADLKYKRQQEK